jgi:hypothetical protein
MYGQATLHPARWECLSRHTLQRIGGGGVAGQWALWKAFSLCCVGVVELVLGCRLWGVTVGCALWHKVQVFTGFRVCVRYSVSYLAHPQPPSL